ncbi:MAG: hypothetical protein GY718_09795 [Lentisphaerae bacterium]|nr:hypothetical protein [Lentisphaerota bacterium]
MADFAIPDEIIPEVTTGNFKGQVVSVGIHELHELMKVVVWIGYRQGGTFVQIGNRGKKLLFKNIPEDVEAGTPEDTSFTDARTALLSGGAAFVAYILSRWDDF